MPVAARSHAVVSLPRGQAVQAAASRSRAQILREVEYGRSVDWWAFGVLLYEMLLSEVRLLALRNLCVMRLGKHGEAGVPPPHASTDCRGDRWHPDLGGPSPPSTDRTSKRSSGRS